MKHIERNRLHQFAIEAIDLTEAENIHVEDCVTCWKRLVTEIQLAVFETADLGESRLVN
jgi:hypothetical protein